jgi:transposase
MEQASSHPPSADVSLSDVFAVETLDPVDDAAHPVLRRFPIHVAPQPDEALVSWLARLAGRYDAPPLTLVQAAIGLRPVDPRRSREAWWQRPGPNVIETISQMTGIAIESVRATTFEDWALSCRHEGAPDRFSARHFRVVRPDGRRMRRFVVCPACLAGDAEPYVRKTWTLGWVAVCARHRTVLLSTCPTCWGTFRLPALSSFEPFAPDICRHCGAALASALTREAHAAAIRLQDALLDVKRLGMAGLPGLGVVDWPTTMAAADVLLGTIWIGTEPNLRGRLLKRIANDLGLGRVRRGLADNYAGLLILAWLFEQWPDRLHITMRMLWTASLRHLVNRWDDIDANLRARLLHNMGHGRTTWSFRAATWSAWAGSLDGPELRASARRERYAYRRIRLLAIADVCDGKRIETVANAIDVQAETVHRWLQQGAAGGLDAALEWKSNSALNSAQRAELAVLIARGGRRAGNSYAWSARDIQAEAKARFGVELSIQAAARLRTAHTPKGRRQPRQDIAEQQPSSLGADWSPVFSGPVHSFPDQSAN